MGALEGHLLASASDPLQTFAQPAIRQQIYDAETMPQLTLFEMPLIVSSQPLKYRHRSPSNGWPRHFSDDLPDVEPVAKTLIMTF